MGFARALCAAVLLLAAPAEVAGFLKGSPGPKDKQMCCTMCQRFGMKALEKWNSAFAGITSPVTCCNTCETVFSSTPRMSALQTSKGMTLSRCKTTCHRFGMKALGGDFAKLTSPVECSALCEKKYQ
mmetsp:Transcript_114079/g.355244  ORF Transcript_114079/g.355244 Transcript_114079/m.355244 type:complete len:127 (+) Transcript_114079:62-442(+)